jgi:hypothetical protein
MPFFPRFCNKGLRKNPSSGSASRSLSGKVSVCLPATASLDFLTRMEGTDGKAMTDLYTRMVGAQQ